MKQLLGLILVVLGIAVGLYVGVWLCLIGGIVQIIGEIKGEFEAIKVAIGVTRIVFASLCGWLSGILLIAPGVTLIKD